MLPLDLLRLLDAVATAAAATDAAAAAAATARVLVPPLLPLRIVYEYCNDRQVRACLESGASAPSSLTNEFYSLIPTVTGRAKPPSIDDFGILGEKEAGCGTSEVRGPNRTDRTK